VERNAYERKRRGYGRLARIMAWKEITDLEYLKKRGYKPMGNAETLQGIKSFIMERVPSCPECGSFMHTASPYFGTLALCPKCDVLFYKEAEE